LRTLQHLDDNELLALLKAGDRNAFTQLYGRYSALLYVYAFKLLGDTDSAKDMVQEIFIAVWDKRDSTDYHISFASYLYTSVRFKFLKAIAHQKVKAVHAENFLSLFDEKTHSTEAYITEKELVAKVESLVAELPPQMARVFMLSRLQHLSNQEVADKLQLSEKTVRNLLSKATAILKPKIGAGVLLLLLHI